jgi:phospholipid/cholesterol/gamma-HCH transport system substrate-binding protein
MTKERWVGGFFFLGIFLLGLLTFMVDDEGHIWGADGTQYKVLLPNTAQIGVGSLVRQSGLKAGRIDATEIVPVGEDHYEVQVTFSILPPFKVREDSMATLEMATLLQGMYLSVTPGTPNKDILKANSLVTRGQSSDLMSTVAKIGETLEGLKDGGLGRMALGKDGYEKIGKILDTLAEDGGLGKWILGKDAQKNLDPTIAELRKTVANVRKGTENEGIIARLLNDEKMGKQFEGIVTDVREGVGSLRTFAGDIAKGKGVIARLTSDEELGKKVADIVTDVRGVAADLRKNESVLARLVSDGQMGSQFSSAIGSFSTFADGLATGEGTIARLINDPELYVEAKRLLSQAREAVEDAREAAPISSFTSVLFGAVQ